MAKCILPSSYRRKTTHWLMSWKQSDLVSRIYSVPNLWEERQVDPIPIPAKQAAQVFHPSRGSSTPDRAPWGNLKLRNGSSLLPIPHYFRVLTPLTFLCSLLLHIPRTSHIMSTHQILPPAREMTDFEQHVYECTYMIGKEAADVVRIPANPSPHHIRLVSD
jgi:hypothetical protein